MMVPTLPIAYFIVGQPCLALGTLNTFLDAVLSLGRAGEFLFFRTWMRIGQVVVRLKNTAIFAVSEADNDQDLFVTFLPFFSARNHAPLDHLYDEWTFRSITYVDFGPVAFALYFNLSLIHI